MRKKHRNNNRLLAGGIAVLTIAAAVIWYFAFFSVKPEMTASSNTDSVSTNDEESNSNKFATLKGDAFDEAYIADMLAHHEGALYMAEQAGPVVAQEELLTLTGTILQTQGMEMVQLKEWQKAWGYKETMSGGHMSQGGAGMDTGGDMVEMMNKLKGLEGEAYDKEFLKQMTIHHEQAIEMSRYANANAKRQEIKDFAKNTIETQTTEINQMKQWQQQWGY
ncbi:MAG TPA: DUF305 domain-containing protein [Candidatus Saccharimonadaceae bacterium]|nr:DUF305 domain-containing protein [Candidatus Saccharimonadaceae bacterium]